MKKITIVSRHYPPSRNVNGILANEMARHLTLHGADVSIVCIDRDAEGNQSPVEPFGHVIRVKPLSGKQNGLAKLFNLIYDGYTLMRRSKQHPSDLIICTTSPPLLPFWAATLLGKRAPWALWSLDLFPEGFVAAGTWKENSWLYKALLRKTYKTPPDLLISLGAEQARHIREKYRATIPAIILPAGVTLDPNTNENSASVQPDWYQRDKIVLGYFGNVGQAHNPEFIKQVIASSSEKNMLFVLAVYGIHADEVKAFAAPFTHTVIIENGLPKEHLPFIDIHLVSLRTSWTHIAVPSKAVTAVSSGRPILFCGSERSDNWQMFKDAGWLIDEQQDLKNQVAQFIAAIDPAAIQEKASHTNNILVQLKQQVLEAYKAIADYDRRHV